MPIPKGCDLAHVVSVMKTKLWSSIGTRIPAEFKVYIRASRLTQQIQDAFDMNGIVQIQVPSKKPGGAMLIYYVCSCTRQTTNIIQYVLFVHCAESVDKRMMVDMTFTLYELERDDKSRPIALISGDKGIVPCV